MSLTINQIYLTRDELSRDESSATLTREYVIEFSDETATIANCVGATWTPAGGDEDDAITIPAPNITQSFADEVGRTVVMRMKRWNAKPDDESPFCFRVSIDWDSKVNEQKPPDTDETPIWGVDVEIKTNTSTQPAYFDKDTEPVANSAGDSYSQQPEETLHDEVLSVKFSTSTGHVATIDGDLQPNRGKVNNDSITFSYKGLSKTYTSRKLKLADGGLSYNRTNDCWDVSLEFHAREDGWKITILDQGLYTKVAGSPRKRCLDGNNQPAEVDQLLDGDGGQLAEGDDPRYNDHPIEKEVAFASLFTGVLG